MKGLGCYSSYCRVKCHPIGGDRPDMTIAVYLDVKQQQTNVLTGLSRSDLVGHPEGMFSLEEAKIKMAYSLYLAHSALRIFKIALKMLSKLHSN